MHHHHRDHPGIEDPRALTIPTTATLKHPSFVRSRRELKKKQTVGDGIKEKHGVLGLRLGLFLIERGKAYI